MKENPLKDKSYDFALKINGSNYFNYEKRAK